MKHWIRYTLLLVCCGAWRIAIKGFSQEEYRNDCNLQLQEIAMTDFWFFTKEDIEKAYANMRSNCPPMRPDETVPQSAYFFDHLIWIGLKKLEGEAETIWLKSSDDWLKFKELVTKSISITTTQEGTIPSLLQNQYEAIRDRDGVYNASKARYQWIYEWSTWLYAQYLALCDLARGLNFNSEVVKTVAWTKTIALNTKYNSCLEDITRTAVATQQNRIDASTQVVNGQAKSTLQESMNIYSQQKNAEIRDQLQKAQTDYQDISTKAWAGWAMKDCNPGS